MSSGVDWRRVFVAPGTMIEVPPSLLSENEQGIDSSVTALTGAGVRLVVDQGPFADSLTSYGGQEGYEESTEEIASQQARIVSYQKARGERGYVVAAQFPGLNRLTISVNADDGVPRELPMRIIRSVRIT